MLPSTVLLYIIVVLVDPIIYLLNRCSHPSMTKILEIGFNPYFYPQIRPVFIQNSLGLEFI